jgi:hypothetical protein
MLEISYNCCSHLSVRANEGLNVFETENKKWPDFSSTIRFCVPVIYSAKVYVYQSHKNNQFESSSEYY